MDFVFITIKEKFKFDTSVRRSTRFPPNLDKPMVVKRGKDEIFNEQLDKIFYQELIIKDLLCNKTLDEFKLYIWKTF